MPTTCRLIIDPPQPGGWNMAVDEWLLRQAADKGQFALRFYEWSQPTLSLGYFQSYDERHSHPSSLACPVVRRASGGGALVHHHELTYSLAVPAGHPLAISSQTLYDAVHRSLIEVLAGIVPPEAGEFTQCREAAAVRGGEQFLCFLRRAKGDVVFAQSSTSSSQRTSRCDKICGSAQRRHRGAVLQHGGVLLQQSLHAPQLAGIQEVCGRAISPIHLREYWAGPLRHCLGLAAATPTPLTKVEENNVQSILAGKFANESWTRRR
jgi:lipoate-protein ligase A